MKALLAGKGYDASYIAEKTLEVNANSIISTRFVRKNSCAYDADLYKEKMLSSLCLTK